MDAAEVWARAGLDVQGQGAATNEFRFMRDDLVLFTYLHLAAYPEVAHALDRRQVDRHRVRDRATAERAAAVARTDERGCRPHGAADRRALPRAGARRARRVARRCSGRPAGACRRARGGQRRVERRLDRAGHGGRGAALRQEPRPAALGRPDPQGPHHDAGEQPRRGRPRGGRRRSRDRGGPRARRAGARARHRRHDRDA